MPRALAFGPDAAALDLAGPTAATALLGLLVSPQDGPVRLSLPDLRCADANDATTWCWRRAAPRPRTTPP